MLQRAYQMAVLVALALSACHPSGSSDTALIAEAEAAHAFAERLEDSVGPILESQGILESFALQMVDDVNHIRADRLNALGDAVSTLFNDLGNYLAGAVATDDNGNITDIDWTKLSASGQTYSDGVTITLTGNTLTLTGTDVIGTYKQTTNRIDAYMVISLPNTELTDNTLSLAMTNLSIIDDYNTHILANTCHLAFTFQGVYSDLGDVINSQPPREQVSIEIDDATVILTDAITLIGNGIISINNSTERTPTQETERVNFEMDITGILGNSIADNFSAPMSVRFFYTDTTTRTETDGRQSTNIIGTFDVDLDLSKATSYSTMILANLTYNLAVSNVDTDIDLTNKEQFQVIVNSIVELTIGNNKVDLILDTATARGRNDEQYISEFDFTVIDAIDNGFDITLKLLADTDRHFSTDKVTIGSINVNGKPLAKIVVLLNTGEVIADFKNLNDVVLISTEELHRISTEH